MEETDLTELSGKIDALIEALDEHAAALRDHCRLLREQRERQPAGLAGQSVVPTTGRIDGELTARYRPPRSFKLPAKFKPFLSEAELQAFEARHGKQLAEGYGPAWKELPAFHGKEYDSLLDLLEGEGAEGGES